MATKTTSKKKETAPEAVTEVKEAPKAAAKTTKTTKAAAAKTAAPKTTAKTAAPKAPRAPKAPAVKLFVEYQGVQVSQEDIVAAIKANWTGEAIKTLEVYVKPEDAAAYYVVNGGEGGKVTL